MRHRYIRSNDALVVLVEGFGLCLGTIASGEGQGSSGSISVMRIIEKATDVTCVSSGECSSNSVALGHSSGSVSLLFPPCNVGMHKHQRILIHASTPDLSESAAAAAAAAVEAHHDAIVTLHHSGSDHCRGPVSILAYDS